MPGVKTDSDEISLRINYVYCLLGQEAYGDFSMTDFKENVPIESKEKALYHRISAGRNRI